MRRLTLLLLAVGVVFLVCMLNQVGWTTLAQHLLQVGWVWWPLILIPYGLVNLLEAISWHYLLLDPATRPSLNRLFWLRLAGRVGRVRAWLIALSIAQAAFAGALWLGPGDLAAYGAICLLTGLAFGAG